MYAQDYDGHLPAANDWQDLVAPYLNNSEVFHCPMREGPLPHYALSPFVAGRKLEEIAEPESTVMIYEVGKAGQPAFPHNDGMNVGYVDGQARWVSEGDAPEQIRSSGFAPPARNYGIADQLKIAYTASVQVVVENLYHSVLEAEAAVRQYGGFILNSSLDGRSGRASLTLKVPTPEVGNVVNALGALGFVAHREISGEDLTRRYTSAGREIEQTHERTERLQTMVEEMDEDEPRVAAEQNLGSVERERTELRDRVWDIDARTTLATVSATLTEQQPEVEPPTIADAFREAVSSLAVALTVMGKAGAWVLVFAPLWGAALTIAWLLLKRAVRGDE
jgi:prepilin-type processing-associated H-X9-DG protein